MRYVTDDEAKRAIGALLSIAENEMVVEDARIRAAALLLQQANDEATTERLAEHGAVAVKRRREVQA